MEKELQLKKGDRIGISEWKGWGGIISTEDKDGFKLFLTDSYILGVVLGENKEDLLKVAMTITAKERNGFQLKTGKISFKEEDLLVFIIRVLSYQPETIQKAKKILFKGAKEFEAASKRVEHEIKLIEKIES